MGFFSKLFKPDSEGEAAAQPAAPDASTETAASEASAPQPPEPPPARAGKSKPPPPPERTAARASVTRSPVPPPPPPPLGAAAPAAAAVAAPPAAAAPPPPPPAGSASTSRGAAPPPSPARGSAAQSTAAKPPKNAKAPTPALKAETAIARKRNATIRGLPAVQPVLGASPPEAKAGADASAQASEDLDQAPTLEFKAVPPETFAAENAFAPSEQAAEPAPAAQTASAPEPAHVETAVPESQSAFETAVDAAVDSLLARTSSRPQQAEPDAARAEEERLSDQRAAGETFRSLLAANAAQVRELMFQLSVGRMPRHWAASCRPVIAPFLDGARQIELSELSDALAQFDAALLHAASESSAYVRPETCAVIEQAYARLAALQPEAFAIPPSDDGRRRRLLESLLLQVPAMYRRTLNKLYGAGLGSLEQLSGASADEIAAVAGIDHGVAEAITKRVRQFEQERSKLDPALVRSHVHERLRAALVQLRNLNEQFERAELEEAAERKREVRRAREAAGFELELLLSEIGEESLIDDIKRCAVRGKITRVESYLDQVQASV